MNLGAKASGGYAMAALLVAMSVMSVMLSIALPAWSHLIRREREEELIFRGNQYARAINLYQRKYANASPANLDVLIKERLLRKKFKDPLSPNEDGEFQMLYLQNQSTVGGPGARGAGSSTGATGQSPSGRVGGSIGPSPSGRGAIIGVVSKNTGQSIRVYKGKTRYDEWQFIGMELNTQAGPGGGAGRGAPPRGGPPRGGPPPGGLQRGDPQRRGGGSPPPITPFAPSGSPDSR